jgi:hypothetical protein
VAPSSRSRWAALALEFASREAAALALCERWRDADAGTRCAGIFSSCTECTALIASRFSRTAHG